MRAVSFVMLRRPARIQEITNVKLLISTYIDAVDMLLENKKFILYEPQRIQTKKCWQIF